MEKKFIVYLPTIKVGKLGFRPDNWRFKAHIFLWCILNLHFFCLH